MPQSGRSLVERKPMMPRQFTIHSARSFPGGCSPARNIPKWRRSNFCKGSGLCRSTGTFLVTVASSEESCCTDSSTNGRMRKFLFSLFSDPLQKNSPRERMSRPMSAIHGSMKRVSYGHLRSLIPTLGNPAGYQDGAISPGDRLLNVRSAESIRPKAVFQLPEVVTSTPHCSLQYLEAPFGFGFFRSHFLNILNGRLQLLLDQIQMRFVRNGFVAHASSLPK
jgi:hypothetical protein